MSDDDRIRISEEDLAEGPGPEVLRPVVNEPEVATQVMRRAVSEGATMPRRFGGLSWLPLAAAGVFVTLTVSVGVFVVTKSHEKTSEDFCAALDRGMEDIKTNLPEVPDTGDTAAALEAIVVAIGGIGRYNEMLDDLVTNSPDEIKGQMTTARDTFKSNVDSVPDAVSDPLGAIAGLLWSTLVNEPSFEAVDSYAISHCGASVFGSPV